MKCKELQILDWIQDKNAFQWQIIGVGDDYAYATFEGNEGDPWEFDDKDDQPEGIPITPEILEKNRFERSVLIPSKFYRNTDNERLIFYPHGSCYDLGYVHWNESNDADIMHRLEVQQPIMYIHQMQHALRLIGLSEIADNFKV